MRRLHLLDGTYELFRAYFGAPPRTTPDDREIGAVHGLMSSLLNLLDEDGVTHVAVAFDSVIESFRNQLFPGYKTQAGVPEELLAQFPLAEQGVEALGVPVWRMHEYEADDALATAAHRFADDVDQVVILTPDKDLTQCIQGTRIVGFDRRKGAFVDEDAVWSKFGVAPRSIPDYLALVGDSSDGLPGLSGWGEKSTSMVLAEYGHIEQIPLEASLWKPAVRGAERLVAALRDGIGNALLYRFLATLRRDVPLSEAFDELEWGGVPEGPFHEVCDRWGFGSIRERPRRWR
jgi:5'-3' exonuclease